MNTSANLNRRPLTFACASTRLSPIDRLFRKGKGGWGADGGSGRADDPPLRREEPGGAGAGVGGVRGVDHALEAGRRSSELRGDAADRGGRPGARAMLRG